MERSNDYRSQSTNDRNRNQQDQNRDWNQSNEGSNSQFPNYESNYRPGEYRQYSDRNKNQDYRNNRPGYNRDTYENNLRSGSVNYRNNDWNEDRGFDDYRDRGTFNRDREDNQNRNTGGYYGNRNDDRGYQNGNRNWWDKTKDEVSGWFGDERAQSRRDMDQEHRGKGPKGYTRSDERIKEDIHERLTDDGYVDASEIEVDVKNGEVSLKGSVKNRQQKRRTEDIVEMVSGVKDVENHIKVEGQENNNNRNTTYTNGLRERKGGLEYGPGAVSGMANSSATGDLNTAK